ncbi:MAG TPA: DUF11 domain-containing protein [Candidatus Thermoplasmatota archaeon]|nr:DUF11 domain-containing protein [Candidatus Thermoplasmatota archaeon]
MRVVLVLLVLASLLAFTPSGASQQNVADLRLVKSAIDEFAEPGGRLSFSLNVTNLGPGTATGIVVTDPLPPGTTFDGGAPNCSEAHGVITCTGEDLAPGASFGYLISLRVTTLGTVNNTATVAHDGVDPVPGNNVSSASGEVVEEEPWQGMRCTATADGNLLEWQRMGPADSYTIHREANGGESVMIATVTGSPYLDTNVTAGSHYRYDLTVNRPQGGGATCFVTAIPEFPTLGLAALAVLGSVVAYVALRRR